MRKGGQWARPELAETLKIPDGAGQWPDAALTSAPTHSPEVQHPRPPAEGAQWWAEALHSMFGAAKAAWWAAAANANNIASMTAVSHVRADFIRDRADRLRYR